MSAASSRRNLRRANVRQLSQREPELSHRQIGERLGISKDTVRRDLDAIAEEASADGAAPNAPDAPSEPSAPQVSVGGADGADDNAPVEPGELRRPLPQRMAPLAGAPDLSQWPALRRDLAQLAQSGMSPETLVHQAITAVAHEYRRALDRGQLRVGQRFIVGAVELRPAALLGDRPVPDSALRP